MAILDYFKLVWELLKRIFKYIKRIKHLEEENKKLKEALEIKEKLIFENDAYWINKNRGKDGPFCTRCYDVEGRKVRLQQWYNPAYYECPECHNRVKARPGLDSSEFSRKDDENFYETYEY